MSNRWSHVSVAAPVVVLAHGCHCWPGTDGGTDRRLVRRWSQQCSWVASRATLRFGRDSAFVSFAALALFFVVPVTSAFADDAASGEKYTLRYKFAPGEVIRWNVVHQARVRTTVSGTTQTADTHTTSVKVWRVVAVDPGRQAQLEHSVENVAMRQQVTGREEVRYDSQTDKEPPPGFEETAQSVGVPLSVITIDTRGQVVDRVDKRPRPGGETGQVTVALPEDPVAVGDTWIQPNDIEVMLRDGRRETIKSRQVYKLQSVRNGIAVIRVDTQILTPVDNPEIEAQLIQRETNGEIRFDIEAGRVVAQQMDLDKRVVGFSGESSSLHYETRFSEELDRESARTAQKPKPAAGPEPPPSARPPAARQGRQLRRN